MIYIIAIGTFQSLLLLLLMYNSKHRKPFDVLIKLLLLFVFFHLGTKFIIYAIPTGLFQKGFVTFIDLAYGPLLWMITQKLKHDTYRPAKHWFLYLPTLVAACFFIGITLNRILSGTMPLKIFEIYNAIATIVVLPFLLIFSIISLWESKQIPDFWITERKLVKRISILFLLTSAVFIFLMFPGYLFNLSLMPTFVGRMIFYSVLVIICILIFQYLLVSQAERAGNMNLFSEKAFQEQEPKPLFLNKQNTNSVIEIETLAKPTPSNTKHQQLIMEKLDQWMQDKKIYKDPELNLDTLSEMTKISRHQISETLNHYLGKSYYAYINEYRIKEVIILLDKCKKQGIKPNILTIAFEMGFNSKSSFHLYFKKITGTTPSEYIKNKVISLEKEAFDPKITGYLNLNMN